MKPGSWLYTNEVVHNYLQNHKNTHYNCPACRAYADRVLALTPKYNTNTARELAARERGFAILSLPNYFKS